MKKPEQVHDEISMLVNACESQLSAAHPDVIHNRRNSQSRTIKQILGHLIDSASNNLHRIVHLQYQQSPIQFPDYANLGVNDTWIGIQHYQEEEWPLLIQLWKFSNLHLAHVIGHVDRNAMDNVWISALGENITLSEMIADYPRHLRLHLDEIEELLYPLAPEQEARDREQTIFRQPDARQVSFYTHKLDYETDAWDLMEMLKKDASVVVIDARSKEAYAAEHIPGAVSFPHRQMTSVSTKDLDRSKTYVTYCDGIGCNASTKGALKLSELGFTTRELLGGLDWWKRDGYPTETEASTSGASITCGCS